MFYFCRGHFLNSSYNCRRSSICGTSYDKVFGKLPWTSLTRCWYIIDNVSHTNYGEVLIGPIGDTLEVISKVQPYIKISKWEI